MADLLVDLELWGDVECNSGAKLADLPLPFVASEEADLNGDHRLEVYLDRTDASWASVAFERVLRATFADGDVSEWRIREVEQARGGDNAMTGIIRADHIKYDLIHRSGMLERVEKNGQVWNHFEYYGLSPTAHATIILGEAPGFFTLGTVANNDRVDMIYHQDNPLSALEELASVTGLELEVVRNGATDYRVNLVVKRGDSASTVTIEHAANLLSQSRSQSSADMGTQVYPRGGQEYGDEGSMANHAHLVGFQSGGNIRFGDDLFSEDDQLNGKYVEDNATPPNYIQITDTVAPNLLTLASAPNLSGDRRLRFRRKFTDPVSGDTYGALTFLPSPSAIANYGIKPAILDRSDIPLIDNLVPNPILTDWAGEMSEHWVPFGNPILSKNTDPLYTRHGDGSLHVVTPGIGQGIETKPFYVKPTEERPFFVAQIQLYVVSGHVRLELIDLTNNEAFPPIGKDAATIATEVWIDSFGVAPGGDVEDNFYTKGTQSFKIRITQIGEDAADFYLDAAQCTQTATFRQVFYGGRASNDLWILAKEALEIVQEPSAEYDVSLIDFNRLDPATYSADEIVLGGPVQMTDSDLGLDLLTRLLTYAKNWMIEGDTQITVEGKTNDLTRILGETERRIRKKLAGPYGEEGTTTGVDLDQEEDDYGGGDDDSINIIGDDAREQCASAESEFCTPDSAGDLTLDPSPWDDIVLIEPVADDGPVATEWDGLPIGWSAEGMVTVTGEGAGDYGEVGQEGIMQKVGTGLIYSNPLTSVAGLTVDDGTATFEGIDGELWMKLDYQTAVRATGMAAVRKMRAQVRMRPGSLSDGDELIGRATGSGISGLEGYAHRRNAYGYGGLYRVTTGSDSPLDLGVESGGDTSFVKGYLSVFVEDGNQWAGDLGNPTFSAADVFFDGYSGIVGFRNLNAAGWPQPSWFRDLHVTNGEPVQITGLPTGSGLTVFCAGVSYDVDTEAPGGILDMQLLAGTLLPVRNINVSDSGGDQLETISPGTGIWDGDSFIFQAGGGLVGESGWDSQVVVDLEFYGMDYMADYPNWTYLSTAFGTPTRDENYIAKNIYGLTEIPVGTMMIRPVLRRIGGTQAIACVRRLLITQGTRIPAWIPCEIRFGGVGTGVGLRIPTDEGLLLYLPFDDFKYPKGNHPDSATSWIPAVADPDGTIALSRTEFDASVNRSHFEICTKKMGTLAGSVTNAYREPWKNGWMPEKGVSGWGRIITNHYEPHPDTTYCALGHRYDLDRGTEPAPLDVWEGFTVSFWMQPFLYSWMAGHYVCGLYDDKNGIEIVGGKTYYREQGGWQIAWSYGWDMLAHLYIRWRFHDPGLSWGTGDTYVTSIRFNADPAFGNIDSDSVPEGKSRDVGDLCDQFAFLCVRFSEKYTGSTSEGRYSGGWQAYSGDCMDLDVFVGNSLTGSFKKLGSLELFNETTSPDWGAASDRHSMTTLPAITGFTNRGSNPNNSTQFTVAGSQVQQWMFDHAQYDWDPSPGVYDEFRLYDRVLSDEEVRGLFSLGCGSQPHTQACDQIYSNVVGAGAVGPAHTQTECGGADPLATLWGINNLI